MKPAGRSLQLEPLESRTLLAGPASPAFAADFELAVQSLSGIGPYEASFSLNFGNSQLVLTGETGGALTINLDLLPAFVTNLRISSFAEVTFLGTDRVDNLVISDVASVAGANLSVTKSLHLTNVGSVDLASAGAMALLKGSSTELSVQSLGNTMILSDLQSLTINSESSALFVVGLNSEQSLYLKYRPESISLAGLTSASVHLVQDIAIPGTDPIDSGSKPGGNDVVPTPDPEPVKVITLPLDERIRLFIAELRQFLRTSNTESQQLVFDFMTRNGLESGLQLISSRTPGLALMLAAEPHESEILARSMAEANNLVREIMGLREADPVAAVGQNFVSESTDDAPVDVAAAALPRAFFGPLNIDATWPVAVAPAQARDGFQPVAQGTPVEARREDIEIEDTFRAFGSFLVERVTTEYSGGQQSFVLLVDPRPSRPAGTNPTSALDLFSRSNRTSLSSLQQVMA